MRLIDADALKKAIEQGEGVSWDKHGKDDLCVRKKYIDNAPTVEMPNQIIWEQGYECGKNGIKRPQGEWVDHSDEGYVECPFCGSCTTCEDNKDELNFCWNCGALMKGGAE